MSIVIKFDDLMFKQRDGRQSATFDVSRGFSVVPHIGHQRIAGAVNGIYSYINYSLTLGKGLAFSASVVGTDANKANYFTPAGKFTGKAGVVLGLKYSF